MTESIRGASLGFVCLQLSEYERASMMAGNAWRTARQTWMLHDVVTYSLPILMESLLGPNWTESVPGEALSQVKGLSRWSKVLFYRQRNHQPHILRILARLDTARGRKRRAIRRFERAVAYAERHSMKYQKARCLLDLAAVKDVNQEGSRRTAVALLREMESVIPRAESWLLADQYDEAVVAPEFDLEAWERQHGRLP